MIDIASFIRPNTVSIFAVEPGSGYAGALARLSAFVLTNVIITDPKGVRLDLTHSITDTQSVTVARSPVEKAVADNIRLDPRSISVTGTLSPNPLGIALSQVGAFGSIVRRDLSELRKLEAIQARREPVIAVTPFKVFSSAAFSITATHPGTNKVDLTLAIEEIVIVDPLTVGIIDLDAALFGADTSTDLGAQPTSTVVLDVGGGLG